MVLITTQGHIHCFLFFFLICPKTQDKINLLFVKHHTRSASAAHNYNLTNSSQSQNVKNVKGFKKTLVLGTVDQYLCSNSYPVNSCEAKLLHPQNNKLVEGRRQ